MEKQIISAVEFEKKVQIEAQHLVYFDRMKEDEANKKAVEYISSKYVVG